MTVDKKKIHQRQKKGGSIFDKTIKKQFKDKADSNDAFKHQPLVLQLDEDTSNFPRGGKSLLSKRERDEIRAQVDAEFISKYQSLKRKKPSKKWPKAAPPTENDFGYPYEGALNGELPQFANKVTLKNIIPGMKLWGVVTEVYVKHLMVSLPCGLHGMVRSIDAVDPVSDIFDAEDGVNLAGIFHAGQLVSCIVVEVVDDMKDGKRKIKLSLRLSLLYQGFSLDAVQEGMTLNAYVKSIEDHGYILYFGLSSFVGFLPKNNQTECKETKMRIGQFLQGVVRRIDNIRKVVYVSADPDALANSVIKNMKGLSFDLLIPGMMVTASVLSTLRNGIMLSFLTYFSGTVSIFHLDNSLPGSLWKDEYYKDKKVNARILFIDISTRAIGLTLNQFLLHNTAHVSCVKIGDIYDSAKVIRVDRQAGLLLEIPSSPLPTPAYVNISDIAEDDVPEHERKFKGDENVRVRILNYKNMEGLAIGTMKASDFQGPILTHANIKSGMVVTAKIIFVDENGALVQFAGGVKAFCSLHHMSEFEISKPRKKFKAGAELLFRVLGCKSKRINVTHKKTLVKSKLPILSSYSDAIEGLVTHGWISKIRKHGCSVHFYNGVHAFASRAELGLDPDGEISPTFHVGQVVKCRVIDSFPTFRRINLSFITRPGSNYVSERSDVNLGSIIAGVVEKVTDLNVIVSVKAKGFFRGTISIEHLSDHHGLARLMKSVLRPGYVFDQLLVLEMKNALLLLSAKYSLINSVHQLLSDTNEVHPQLIIFGYICNIIESGCFVRFLGSLTGFCPKKKALDNQKANISDSFYVGQSVRCTIVDVDSEKNRFTVSLKHPCCYSSDASFLEQYFTVQDKVALMHHHSFTGGCDLKWAEGFNIGSVVEGRISEKKEFGFVVVFNKCDHVLGFLAHDHVADANVEIGSTICAAVLDFSTGESLVDLSLKQEFVGNLLEERECNNEKNHKRHRADDLEMQQIVSTKVEIVKENYLVLSVPEQGYAIGYASLSDYNTQKHSLKRFLYGQSVMAKVVSLPGCSPTRRLLLLLDSITQASEISTSKRAKKKHAFNVGSLVQGEITQINTLYLILKFGTNSSGRVHITEVDDSCAVEDPFCNFRIGEILMARIISVPCQSSDKKKNFLWELSLKPTLLADSFVLGDIRGSDASEFSVGQRVNGYVCKVASNWVLAWVSRCFKALLYVLQSSCEPAELEKFESRFHVGKQISGYVLKVSQKKASLLLTLRPPGSSSHQHEVQHLDVPEAKFLEKNLAHFHIGDVIGGRITKVYPGVGGLLVEIGLHINGRVHFMELSDLWVDDPLENFREGQFVKCKVLEITYSVNKTVHIDLSLRLPFDEVLSDVDSAKRIEKVEDVYVDMPVQGYVMGVSPKGCFMLLSRKLDAKILISNLSNGYVDNPQLEFPIGKLISGRVKSVDPLSKRIEVTLKKMDGDMQMKSEIINVFNQFSVGEVVSGRIKRLESFGLFIAIDDTNMVGLCHVSELPDTNSDNILRKYKTGDKVSVKIIKMDVEKHRISFGMKGTELNGAFDDVLPANECDSFVIDGGPDMVILKDMSAETESGGDEEDHRILLEAEAEAEARYLVPPLEVTFDETEQTSGVDLLFPNQELIGEEEAVGDRKTKKTSEEDIRAAEERLLEEDVPRNEDEFERWIRGSPNSSFHWLKYMQFMCSLCEIEKARSIAERALQTINFREENEKLNIWVAYLNLEYKYGNPPEEAVNKLFQRALQQCDSRSIHFALLELYQRTEQHELVDELLHKMAKKFRDCCDVWLRWICCVLQQGGKDKVENIVKRALLGLPFREHIKFITQSAILQFKHGVPDRGRSLFEGMLREYPKRIDLWSVYLDQEIKVGDEDVIRSLFERATSLSLSPKRMKFLFKKYLEYETCVGDEERIESVKHKAMDYIENAME